MVPPLNTLLVFRIEHKDNLAYILEHGMHTRDHTQLNPDHVFIGHTQLTAERHEWPVEPCDIGQAEIGTYGTLGQYVPFYFGPRSPMLYVVKNGYNGVQMRPQRDIVYLCCHFATIAGSGQRYVFTNGHAKNKLTYYYSRPENLNQLHWDTIYSKFWKNTELEFDRERRKQAELLVPVHVPPDWIRAIVVHDDEMCTFAQDIVDRLNHQAKVKVNPADAYNGCGFYYDE